jgi:hypothetical protein
MEQILVFPTYIYYKDLDIDLNKIRQCIIENTIDDGRQINFTTEHLDELDPMQELVSNIVAYSHEALKNWGFKKQPIEFRALWGVTYKEHSLIKQHGHINTWLAGCFYLDTVEDDGLLFHDPRTRSLQFQSEVQQWNNFNTPIKKVKAIPGRMYIFPAWLEHSTDFVPQGKIRRALSWNIKMPNSVSGGYGDYA